MVVVPTTAQSARAVEPSARAVSAKALLANSPPIMYGRLELRSTEDSAIASLYKYSATNKALKISDSRISMKLGASTVAKMDNDFLSGLFRE